MIERDQAAVSDRVGGIVMAATPGKFHLMAEGVRADWRKIALVGRICLQDPPERKLTVLKTMFDSRPEVVIAWLEDCLQSATSAHRDGRDDDDVVCARLHEVGDVLEPARHGIFQGCFFNQFLRRNPEPTRQAQGHPDSGHLAEFCEPYDQNRFCPDSRSLTLAGFAPMANRVFLVERSGTAFPV
jgi:hypothetical protein